MRSNRKISKNYREEFLNFPEKFGIFLIVFNFLLKFSEISGLTNFWGGLWVDRGPEDRNSPDFRRIFL